MKILIALPVYNEQIVLKKSITTLVKYCRNNLASHQCSVVICDNNSTDNTAGITQELTSLYPEVSYVFTTVRGKGNAWRQAFLAYDADVYCMMDSDLATDLNALPQLIATVASGTDLAIGSRFLPKSTFEQSVARLIISKCYINLVNMVFATNFTDFQCGFKAMSRNFCDKILANTHDKEFFLDTEILLISKKLGCTIKEIPVTWSDFREPRRVSSIKVIPTILQHLYKVFRFRLKY